MIENATSNILITSKDIYRPAPIFLDGNVPYLLDGLDLSGYFAVGNLVFSGMSPSNDLPEGLYKFRFEIYDFYRNTRLADPFPSNQQAWVLLNDPPLLNFPADANLMLPQDPANIVFGWTPRQNSPNSAFIANYEFTLVEFMRQILCKQ